MDRRMTLGAPAVAFTFSQGLNVLREDASLARDNIRSLRARRQEQGWSDVRP